MSSSDVVQVRALEGHADDDAATGWRHAGQRYDTTMGLARRRERAGLVDIQPDETPEEEFEGEEGAQEPQETDDSDETEAHDGTSEQEDDEEAEDANAG